MYALIRPLLFRLDAETSHDLALRVLALASRLAPAPPAPSSARLRRRVMGIDFPNPVGLAAGLDKHARAANALSRLGFGWLELGTVTPQPQPGAPRPRLFRVTEHQALINRMGFNSVGLDAFIDALRNVRPGIITGVNIGKNAATPLKRAAQDYLEGLERVYELADYVAVNVSSPNTPGLRDLQQEDALDGLLGALHARRERLADRFGRRTPLVVKISPDADAAQLDAIARILRKNHVDGVAATNTTLSRDAVASHPRAGEHGGLSGRPLRHRSTEVVRALYRNLQDEIPIIGIGGIHNGEDAREKFDAGARLVQVYTGLVYRGPRLVREIHNAVERAGQ